MPNESGEHIRGDLKRAQPCRVIINLRGGDDLVRFRLLEQRFDPASHRFRRSNRGAARSLQHRRLFSPAPETFHALALVAGVCPGDREPC